MTWNIHLKIWAALAQERLWPRNAYGERWVSIEGPVRVNYSPAEGFEF